MALCFKDKTFCSAQCKNHHCHRNWTDDLHHAAVKWWGSEGAPVAFMDYSKTCEEYKP